MVSLRPQLGRLKQPAPTFPDKPPVLAP